MEEPSQEFDSYRTFDRFDRPVLSFAALVDERAGRRPNRFGYSDHSAA
jgi:hypothetical protein